MERRGDGYELLIQARGYRSLVAVRLATAPTILPGDRLVVRGQLQRPRAARNPFTFDARRYYLARGAGWLMADPRLLHWQAAGPSPRRALERLRRAAIAHAQERFTPGAAALVAALVFGDREALPDGLSEAVRATGTAHLLAVSGQHLSLLVAFVGPVVGRLAATTGVRWSVLVAIAVMYAFLAGAQPPVVRAALAASLALLGPALGRPVDGLNVSGAAAWVMLVVSPLQLLDLSFRLSFLALLGIVVLAEPIRRWLPHGLGPEALWRGVAATLAAQAALLPVQADTFGTFTWVAPAANLVLLPISTLVLLGAMLWLPLDLVFGGWALPLTAALEAAVWLFERSAVALASISSTWSMPSLPGWWVVAYYTFLALLVADWRHPLRRLRSPRHRLPARGALVAAVASALWLTATLALLPQGLEIVVLDVGEADAMVVGAPGGGWAVVDAGLDGRPVAAFLRGRGVRRLWWMALTHAHADHQGGVGQVIGHVAVGAVVTAPGHEPLPPVLRRPGEGGGEPTPVLRTVEARDRLPLAPVDVRVLAPLEPARTSDVDVNDRSLVLRLTWAGWSVLLTGDLENAGEARLLEAWGPQGMLQADVLKVAHHGSATSTGPEWLAAVRPCLALISVGANNPYGHPAPEVLARLQQAGSRILRTDRDGAIWLRFRRDRLEILRYAPDGRQREVLYRHGAALRRAGEEAGC